MGVGVKVKLISYPDLCDIADIAVSWVRCRHAVAKPAMRALIAFCWLFSVFGQSETEVVLETNIIISSTEY